MDIALVLAAVCFVCWLWYKDSVAKSDKIDELTEEVDFLRRRLNGAEATTIAAQRNWIEVKEENASLKQRLAEYEDGAS